MQDTYKVHDPQGSTPQYLSERQGRVAQLRTRHDHFPRLTREFGRKFPSSTVSGPRVQVLYGHDWTWQQSGLLGRNPTYLGRQYIWKVPSS
ncbi:hypothetical protein J6590_101297 [Homalodisca vitripennis]|nr:hypothetical protein J6590_103299 [Homalodisca vitripennis]KAG8294523.1 hypothetical protein J6590_101297 [Homalodisca vitripennis]